MVDDAAPMRLGPLPGFGCVAAAHFCRPSIRRAISRIVAESLATKRAKSSGLDPTLRRPNVSNSFCTSGSFRTCAISVCSRAAISGGAPAGSHGAEPVHDIVVLEALFLHGRHVRHAFPALAAGHRERADLALLHQGQRDLGADEEHVDMAAEQVGHRGRRTLVGHLQHVDARSAQHHFRRNVAGGAETGLAVAELARLLARQRHQLLHGLRRQRGPHDEHLAEVLRQQRDVGEVAHRVVRRVGRESGNGGVRCRGNQNGVAVRRRLGDIRGPDHATRAGAVLDDHRLPEHGLQLGRDDTGDLVGRPTRRRRHDDPDQLVGIAGRGLRLRGQPSA